MESARENIKEQYVYRSEVPSDRHRRLVSWYLVARLEGSNVVARIDSLGLFPASRKVGVSTNSPSPADLVRTVGAWESTASGHHSKVIVTLADARTQAARSSQSK
jgi:hypothetical protein